MPTHQTAMRIMYNRETLHHFPAPGKRWRWSDVVGNGEGKVDPKEAHVVSAYLVKHDDGRYSVDQRLEEYLDEKYSIELEGSVTDPQQDTLPGVDSGPSRESVRADGGTDGPRDDHGRELRQVSLTGEDVTDDARLAQARETMRERDRISDQDWCGRAGRAVRDAEQRRLTAFMDAGAGVFHRATGDVYSGPSPAAGTSGGEPVVA
ncbi:hypothetical protein [Halostella salina]|uniref:hypothetical protein n=1 Tax=Halostella salina TaxID=1547897 RepID=UPI0013CF0747|nr:hypothetical protein [Halostella salina]